MPKSSLKASVSVSDEKPAIFEKKSVFGEKYRFYGFSIYRGVGIHRTGIRRTALESPGQVLLIEKWISIFRKN